MKRAFWLFLLGSALWAQYIPPGGSGNATTVNGLAVPASAAVAGTNASSQVVAATGHNIATPLACADTSASGSAQVCNTTPTFTPAAGDCVIYTTTTANTGAALTLNVNSLGAKPVAKWQGATTLAANDVLANKQVLACYDGTNWELGSIGNAPAGSATGNAGFNVSVNAGVFTATPTFTCPSATAGTVGMFVMPTLTAAVTSSTLASCTGSASLASSLTFIFTEDATGGRPVAMPTGFDSCPVNPAANIRTACTYTWDGTTGRLEAGPVGTAGYGFGAEVAAPGTPPASDCFAWFDSTSHIPAWKCNGSATIWPVAPLESSTGTTHTITAASEIIYCTAACTITPLTPVVGETYQFCVQNDDNIATGITIGAVTGVQYETTARTSYKTANTSIVSTGAAKDQICYVSRDATHYNVFSSTGTWN